MRFGNARIGMRKAIGRWLGAVLACGGLVALGATAAPAAPKPAHRSAPVVAHLASDSGPNQHHDRSPPLRSIPPSHTPGKAHPALPIPPGPAASSGTVAH